eukprot:jgi/Botrbrau1/9284/Bobra.0111s0011.1
MITRTMERIQRPHVQCYPVVTSSQRRHVDVSVRTTRQPKAQGTYIAWQPSLQPTRW